MPWWRFLTSKKLFWPLFALAILLAFNLFFTPHFFRLEMKEGHLYGNVIDILKNGAPIMLLAIGLTLVIATKGIDISVGSVVAISAGVVAMLIGGDLQGTPKYPIWVAMSAAVIVSILAGMWNGMLVSRVGMQPIIATLILFVAGRGIAMVTTNAMVVWLYAKPFALLGQGYIIGPAFLDIYRGRLSVVVHGFGHEKGRHWDYSSRQWASTRGGPRFAGINAKNILFVGLRVQWFLRGHIRSHRMLHGNERGRQQCRPRYELDAILAVVLGGTSLNGGKFYLSAA